MTINPDLTQAFWESGSACFQILNVRAIRQSKSIAGVHWLPTAFFSGWGVYNLWFYTVLNLPLAYWAGLAITCTNFVWLGHLAYYAHRKRRMAKSFRALMNATDTYINLMRQNHEYLERIKGSVEGTTVQAPDSQAKP